MGAEDRGCGQGDVDREGFVDGGMDRGDVGRACVDRVWTGVRCGHG